MRKKNICGTAGKRSVPVSPENQALRDDGLRYGLTSSSETARKLLNATGENICGDTVLRDLHRMAVPGHDNVSRIVVDDWAFRKG